MKKWIRFNLLLTAVVAGVFVFTAAKSSQRSLEIITQAHPENCYQYYIIVGHFGQVGCNSSCPSGCTTIHMEFVEESRAVASCHKGLRYNPETLGCDDPWKVKCTHDPVCGY